MYFLLLSSVPIICLSGPLNAGIVLVVAIVFFANVIFTKISKVKVEYYIDKKLKIAFLFLTLFSFGSLHLGTYNSINNLNIKLIIQIYKSLPKGIYYQVFIKLGFTILFCAIAVNYFLLKNIADNNERIKILNLYKWIFTFSVVCILFLPFGGYRQYRPNVLKFNTILPITVAFIFLFAKSSLSIIPKIESQKLKIYLGFLLLTICIFTLADKPEFNKNECEKNVSF